MMIPYGLNVDEVVVANALKEVVVDELGYSSQLYDLNPRVIFSTFSDETIVTYTDYNRVFVKGNSYPLVFPGVSYPDGSGVGIGKGLKYNVGTLIIRCDFPVSAIRVRPACSLSVSVSSGLNDTGQFVGFTSSVSDFTSEFSFANFAAYFVVLDHIGSLNLHEIELFTSYSETQFSTFPILKTGETLPYLVSDMNSLQAVRKGGLRSDKFTLYTVNISTNFENTRVSQKDVYNIPLEQYYLEEANLYDHILKDSNLIFPLVSSIERNCLKHQHMTQSLLKSINLSDDEKLEQLECNILCEVIDGKLFLNRIVAPQNLEIISQVKYIFSPETIEIDGSPVSEVTLSENESVLFEKNGSPVGILNAVKKLPVEIYEVPKQFMNEYSLNEILDDVLIMSESLSQLTFSKSTNFGNAVSHSAFIDENGETLNCEESIFLPGDLRMVSVYCSDPSATVQILIDEELKHEMLPPNERFSVIDKELPVAAGVHILRTNNGSNVLFRISERSVVHAPIHPSYYTSGQLEQDVFSSSVVTFIAQHNNFDLIDNTTIITKSPTSFISIEDVIFDDFSCTNALFCRKKAVDLKNTSVSFDHLNSVWDFCSEHPWLACLNIEHGCSAIHFSITLENFTFLWYPTTLDNVTIVQSQSCIFVMNNKLVLTDSTYEFECDANDIYVSKWNHVAFTNHTFVINGRRSITLQRVRPGSRIVPSRTVVGTSPTINLKSLLNQNIQNEIQLQDFTADRLHESDILLRNIEFIQTFDMTVSHLDTTTTILTWSNTGSGTLPEQIFRLVDPIKPVYSILGLSLPFSILSIEMKFTKGGYVKNLCIYRDSIPSVVITDSIKNRDAVIDFQIKSATSICTNQELNTVKTEHYDQVNIASDGTFRWIVPSVPSSFYVTPPSLIMMATSQIAPYSTSQSLLILFNRRIEVFLKDDSTLFTINGSNGSTSLIKARACTLLSSQISVPNSFLNLSPATSYMIHLSRARLFQFEGHVPCLESSISFSTK